MNLVPPFETRVAFYCGIICFASQYLGQMVFDDNPGNAEEIFYGVCTAIAPMACLLLIPAIQCRSKLRAVFALIMSLPLWVLVSMISGCFELEVDNRFMPGFFLLIPGIQVMNPALWGPSVEITLALNLIIFLATANLVLAPVYWRTKFLGCNYWIRLGIAMLVLISILELEIYFLTWQPSRLIWIIQSESWLISGGLFSAIVFGVKPTLSSK